MSRACNLVLVMSRNFQNEVQNEVEAKFDTVSFVVSLFPLPFLQHGIFP